jgi:hypothetical protein
VEEKNNPLNNAYENKRKSPYYQTINSLFTVLYGAIVSWMFLLFTRLESSSSGGQVPEGGSQTLANSVFVFYLGLLVLLFLLTVYAWLYFSRILVYINDTPIGELLSIGLAISPLVSIGFMYNIVLSAKNTAYLYWVLAIAIPLVLWIAKSVQLGLVLRKEKSHPLHRAPFKWAIATLPVTFAIAIAIFIVIMAGIGVRTVFPNLSKLFEWLPVIIIFLVGLLFIYFIGVRFPAYESKIKERMASYVKDGSDSEAALKGETAFDV